MRVIMIRHGSTPGNELKRYIGRTNEPLSEKGIREVLQLKEALKGQLSGHFLIAASPMKRTVQTAQVLFGDEINLTVVPDFRECDFGSFENKNYMELSGDPDYQRWIDSGGTIPFPGGESREGFQDRCCRAFLELCGIPIYSKRVRRTVPIDSFVLVVHGGTIMSIAERFAVDEAGSKLDYYAWHIGNAQALIFETTQTVTEKAEDDHFLRRTGRIGLGEETGTQCE